MRFVNNEKYIAWLFKFSNLTKLYHNKKYLQIISQYLITTEANMNYNCLEFYSNLNNKNYMQLYNKYSNDSERFLFTMYFFVKKLILWHLKIIKQFIYNYLVRFKL